MAELTAGDGLRLLDYFGLSVKDYDQERIFLNHWQKAEPKFTRFDPVDRFLHALSTCYDHVVLFPYLGRAFVDTAFWSYITGNNIEKQLRQGKTIEQILAVPAPDRWEPREKKPYFEHLFRPMNFDALMKDYTVDNALRLLKAVGYAFSDDEEGVYREKWPEKWQRNEGVRENRFLLTLNCCYDEMYHEVHDDFPEINRDADAIIRKIDEQIYCQGRTLVSIIEELERSKASS